MPELPLVGTDFAGYRLRAVLGRGGMSIVYQAENPRLGNLIALKVLAPELANDQVFRTRFREESQIAASLNHPHVIPIHDFGSAKELLYIAMRYVSGTDLRHLIEKRGWLTTHESVHLLEQAARALDAAHRRGLVHRDVKPGNLLISQGSEDGDPDHVYLADFGITKYVGRRSGLTVAGTVLGTVHYVSPEQIQDLAVLGPADQYSLGCVLYECLTGRAPFEKNSNEAIMWAHVHNFAASPSLLRPGLPPAIDEVFARVLAKDPDDRYADCREFIAAARDALATAQPGTGDRRRSPAAGVAATVPAFVPAFVSAVQPAPTFRVTPAPAFTPTPTFQPAPTAAPAPTPTPTAAFPPAPAPSGGQRGGRRGRPVRGQPVRGRGPDRRRVRNMLNMLGVAVLAAGGTATGLLVSQGGNSSIGIHQAAESSPPPSALLSVLDRTEEFTGMLRMSACVEKTATNVQCTNPDPAIASVTFATYPSLSVLYGHYQEIAENLSHQHFTDVENTHVCGAVAPDPTGESTWNHSDQYFTKYSVAQLASGSMSTDTAMGRVFCVQKPDGSAVMVWTQNSGDLLGYATGGEASHEQVWNWFYDIHHNIIFPGQPGMTGMSMSGATTPGQ